MRRYDYLAVDFGPTNIPKMTKEFSRICGVVLLASVSKEVSSNLVKILVWNSKPGNICLRSFLWKIDSGNGDLHAGNVFIRH